MIKIKDVENEGRECSTMISTDRKKLVDFAVATDAPTTKVGMDNIRHFYKTTSNHRLSEGFFARCLVRLRERQES